MNYQQQRAVAFRGVLERLEREAQLPTLTAEALAAQVAASPLLAVLFTGDPTVSPESWDVAVVLPELVASCPGLRACILDPAQSALAAGFKNVFLMGDHGGGQDALRAAAEDLEDEDNRLDETAHVYYVPDLYFKEKEQMKAYLSARAIPYDAHAATDDTSEVMFLNEKKWVRRDKLAPSTAKEQATTGVEGDPTKATAGLGEMFIGWKIDDAVNQIHELLAQKK
ncbi:MAG: creatininase family protein [Proteobacteria bacterium]|nr:creatininase family protein [Pseudomonadota bacterium]